LNLELNHPAFTLNYKVSSKQKINKAITKTITFNF